MPVKNEAWILSMSLAAASVWADGIVVSDQGSTDGSKEIARSFPKVHLIENDDLKDFNEYKMRAPLISTARRLFGEGNILVSLDADEILTPYFDSVDFQKWQQLPTGTVIQFFWGNILYGFEKYWRLPHQNFGYIDDGQPFQTGLIHVPRLFSPREDSLVYECKDMGVIHFQYTDWDRMTSKHRWYQCYERIYFPKKSAVEIYRRYHHMYNPSYFVTPVPNEWKDNYSKWGGVNITDYKQEKVHWWDYKVLSYLDEYGEAFFSQIDIWNFDWEAVGGKKYPYKGKLKDRILLWYLRSTTSLVYRKGWRKLLRFMDRLMTRWTA